MSSNDGNGKLAIIKTVLNAGGFASAFIVCAIGLWLTWTEIQPRVERVEAVTKELKTQHEDFAMSFNDLKSTIIAYARAQLEVMIQMCINNAKTTEAIKRCNITPELYEPLR